MACLLGMAIVLLYTVAEVNGDVYLHMPRGNNNRLNENTQNRQTNNRLFDSQNNNKGGYNVGDKTKSPSGSQVSKQYRMSYFQSAPGATNAKGSSYFPIEWTNQHGCGENTPGKASKLNCNMVLQYMCQPDETGDRPNRDTIRDGVTTRQNNYRKPPTNGRQETKAQNLRRSRTSSSSKGMNEPMAWRDKCEVRDRNKGLFTADQNVKSSKSKSTRQNPNGNRNGYECAEERDYYPYWHPTDWKDIAILTQDASLCNTFQTESFNVKPKHECRQKLRGSNEDSPYSRYNNEKDCQARGGRWTEVHSYLEKLPLNKAQCKAQGHKFEHAIYGKGAPECLVKLPKPDCKVADYTRVNHLGNSENLKASKYMWKLPNFPSNKPQKCVFRLRYNISTDDYDPYKTDSKSNNDDDVIENNPKVNVGLDRGQKLQLALNTAQTGRTFQDRSHVFEIKPRPTVLGDKNIHVLSVRGKRGNIVQAYPAVEYDFVPNNLEITTNDFVHIQWTGSNTHNNRGGGDGQPGDDGEGRGGTDRSNVMSMTNRDKNFFMTMEDPNNIVNNMQAIWAANEIPQGTNRMSKTDIAIQLATSGQFDCYNCQRGNRALTSGARQWQNQLNNAPASFAGMVVKFKSAKSHVYGCTRNNNFSNRSQKGSIVVKNA